jgi:hypothetical protein
MTVDRSEPRNALLNEDDPRPTSDEAMARLEGAIERQRDQAREERFCWIALTIVLVDMVVFTNAKTWAAPVSITALEAILLFVIARKCGVDEISEITARVLDSWSGKTKKNR